MLKSIYNKLYNYFGKQGWWPVISSNPSFEICIGAILTQNTNWNNVEKCIYNLNKAKLIDVDKLRKIEIEKLVLLIRPSGYYNQKAIKIKNFVDFIHNKDLSKVTREELLSVKGIGPETADSILLYAFKKPIFVIDAYTKRIFFRIGLCKEDIGYDELQKQFMNNLDIDVALFNEYHALIVELGKNICKKKTLCEKCPLNEGCEYYNKKHKQ